MMNPIFGLKLGRLALLFVVLLIICAIATLVFEERLVEAVANHLGALAIVGLLACLTAYIAYKKGRDQRRAFILSMLLPVILGAIAVGLVFLSTELVYCGGGVVLLASLIIIAVYACMRRKRI